MYMAPEVIMSLQYDAKADLWSIGTIVFQCLTGKAPFQAQTPQALKQFYEKNANLAPKIPPGTSRELTDLLMRLLRRNAKDRMEFDDFFEHPFLKLQQQTSQPVAVPRTAATSGSPMASPQSPQFYGSPVVMHMTNSPKIEQADSEATQGQSSSDEQVDDFVMIPKKNQHVRYIRHGSNDSLQKNSSNSPGSSYATPEPVPVPTQREAYHRMAKPRTRQLSNPDQDQNMNTDAKVKDSTESKSSTFVADISQLSPPPVQFVIGTPPRNVSASFANSHRRTSAPTVNVNLGAQATSPVGQHKQLTPVKYAAPNSLDTFTKPDFTFQWPGQFEHTNANRSRPTMIFGSAPQVRHFEQSPCSRQQHQHFHQPFANPYYNCCCQQPPPQAIMAPFASPPHMDEQMTFAPPELPEETLLDRDHNETLAKLNFVLALVDCIMELAASRSSPLTIISDATLNKEVLAPNTFSEPSTKNLIACRLTTKPVARRSSLCCTCAACNLSRAVSSCPSRRSWTEGCAPLRKCDKVLIAVDIVDLLTCLISKC